MESYDKRYYNKSNFVLKIEKIKSDSKGLKSLMCYTFKHKNCKCKGIISNFMLNNVLTIYQGGSEILATLYT